MTAALTTTATMNDEKGLYGPTEVRSAQLKGSTPDAARG